MLSVGIHRATSAYATRKPSGTRKVLKVTAYKVTSDQPASQRKAMSSPTADILLIGATGGTGSSVLRGMQLGGVGNERLKVLTTDATSSRSQRLHEQGLSVIQGNLDDLDSLLQALQGVQGIYCHALSKDAAKADPQEVVRGRNLAEAARLAGVQHVVYNGAGGYDSGCPMTQMQQKHQVQDLLAAALPGATTTLQATLFMEELWKRYTRPKILQGTFPFTVPPNKPLQLVAVRDMGLAAATALLNPDTFKGVALELAGDELTPLQMCEAFAAVQGTPVRHDEVWWLAMLARFINQDLHHYTQFLRNQGYKADVAACRQQFPGLLSLRQFLEATHWGDASLTYEGGVRYFD